MSISILASVERVLIAFVSPYRTQTYLFIDSWYKYGEKKNATDRGSQVAGQCLYGEIESPTLSRLNEGDPQYTDPHQDHDEYSVIDKSTNHSTADQQSERETDRHTEIHVHREIESFNDYFPTISSSLSVACTLNRFHKSMVNNVAELLKIDVKELMRAAIMTAIIRPRMPTKYIRFLFILLKLFVIIE